MYLFYIYIYKGMSVMSATSADFPMKNKEVIDDKVYEGRLIAYDR